MATSDQRLQMGFNEGRPPVSIINMHIISAGTMSATVRAKLCASMTFVELRACRMFCMQFTLKFVEFERLLLSIDFN